MVSLTYRAAVDDPGRFAKSKSVGAFFGLTPKRYQSGETDVTGAITRVGDAGVRTALHDAANALLTRASRFTTLKRWAMDVAKRRGMRRAKVALARKLATVPRGSEPRRLHSEPCVSLAFCHPASDLGGRDGVHLGQRIRPRRRLPPRPGDGTGTESAFQPSLAAASDTTRTEMHLSGPGGH